jgi:hypothetical protein
MEGKKRNTGIVYGLIAGLGMILFTIVQYREGVGAFMGPAAYLGYVILIGLAAAAAFAQKKANGGGLEFQEALKTVFTVFVLALAAQTLFSWVLLNFVDTHFREAFTRATFDKDALVMKRFGMSDEDITRAMAEDQGRRPFSLGSMSLGLAFSCIVHFIIALVLAAILKKKKAIS